MEQPNSLCISWDRTEAVVNIKVPFDKLDCVCSIFLYAISDGSSEPIDRHCQRWAVSKNMNFHSVVNDLVVYVVILEP